MLVIRKIVRTYQMDDRKVFEQNSRKLQRRTSEFFPNVWGLGIEND